MNPASSPVSHESSADDIDAAVAAACAACDTWSFSTAPRTLLLRALASALETARERLVALANEETGLGLPRLNGELDRSAFQLRAFAEAVEAREPFPVLDDPAVPGAPPAGHPQLMRVAVPLGPVAMFSASNFPFAFSVLGGDTASALAAGCPVVVKAHPAHPRLSREVFALAEQAVLETGVPAGVLTMVEGASKEVGIHLVRHSSIAAVAFTGSFAGGAALQRETNARRVPVPFYGELGSINPIVALPAAVAANGPELAKMLAASIAQGCGQFCTSPGVLILPHNPHSEAFVRALADNLDGHAVHAMLAPGIRNAFERATASLCAHRSAKRLNSAQTRSDGHPQPVLVEVSVAAFLAEPGLREEVFGPSCVVLHTKSAEETQAVLKAIAGSLTVTIWGAAAEDSDARALVRTAMRIAGRVLFAGVPTGVAVTRGQHHGGPWPASTQPQSTSVGQAALQRFIRPVALQDAPAWLAQRAGVPC